VRWTGLGGQIRGLWRAGLFPMDAASLRELADDIRANGLREPITLLATAEVIPLAGRRA
jgi:hypothetical protein